MDCSAIRLRYSLGVAACLVAVCALAVAVQFQRHRESFTRYTADFLPGHDAYVYLAMAEHPRVFTVYHWGYRVFTPWLASIFSPRDSVAGFHAATLSGVFLAGVALFGFLRALGYPRRACLPAALAFFFTPPVAEVFRNPFLVEPWTLVFETAFLWALASRASVGWLMLLASFGATSKEGILLLLPVVFFVRRPDVGRRRGLVEALLVLAPALLGTLLLRAVWTPHLGWEPAVGGVGEIVDGFLGLVARWRAWGKWLLVGGIVPLAIPGAWRSAARDYLLRYGYALVVTLVTPFLGWISVGRSEFADSDVPRVLIYALPLLFPLCLVALAWLWPSIGARSPAVSVGSRHAAAVLAVAVAVAPALVVDRYRRTDLRGRRDGALTLATVRESLRVASKLASGDAQRLEPVEGIRWNQDRTLGMVRPQFWFLRSGWLIDAEDAVPVVAMQEEASILLPCLRPADWTVELRLSAPRSTRLGAAINGYALRETAIGPGETTVSLRLSRDRLFRGDNQLTLRAVEAPVARLLDVTIRPSPPPTSPASPDAPADPPR